VRPPTTQRGKLVAFPPQKPLPKWGSRRSRLLPRPSKLGTLAVVERAPRGNFERSSAKALVRFPTLLVTLLAAASACGPSIQSIHEGSVRFEHCYRLDLDPKIAPSHRHACWDQWTRVYSYGQARDRVEYARRRINELEAGDPEPPVLSLGEQEKRPEREFYMSMPTDAHAPPPPMATTPTEEPTQKQVVPGDECIIRCRTQRTSCLGECQAPGAGQATEKAKERSEASPAAPDRKAEAPQAATEQGESVDDREASKCACEADYKACAMRCFE